MGIRNRSQREFVAVTLITLISIALIVAVYATILGTYTGGDIEVVALAGDVYYSQDNSTGWALTLSDVGNGTEWYARFEVTTGGPAVDVTITWWLQRNTANMTTPVEKTTSWTLTGGADVIYASSNGAQGTNYDWGQNATETGTYRLRLKVVTA